jgi:hypothetical protein
MLPPILQEKFEYSPGVHAYVDSLKHGEGDGPNGAEVLALLNEAGYKGTVPPGKRYMDVFHPLDDWA